VTWVFVLAIDRVAPEALTASAPLLVVCLCAEWCALCRDYRSSFAQVTAAVQADHPQAQFVWLDIEDDADLLHPLDDVDDFPTLLVAVASVPRFFGPLTPQPQTLERLVRSLAENPSARPLAEPALRAAVARILATRAAA
jgi:thiol-disulfide isomerase/thioredoxin